MKPKIQVKYHTDLKLYSKPTVIVYLKVRNESGAIYYLQKGRVSRVADLKDNVHCVICDLMLMAGANRLEVSPT